METTCTTHARIGREILVRQDDGCFLDFRPWSLYQVIDGERIELSEGKGRTVADAYSQAQQSMAFHSEYAGAPNRIDAWEIAR